MINKMIQRGIDKLTSIYGCDGTYLCRMDLLEILKAMKGSEEKEGYIKRSEIKVDVEKLEDIYMKHYEESCCHRVYDIDAIVQEIADNIGELLKDE